MKNTENLYSLRVNQQGRIIFTIDKDKNQLILLIYDPAHNYNKSINAANSNAKSLQNKSAQQLNLINTKVHDDPDDSQNINKFTQENFDFTSVHNLHTIGTKYIIFNDSNQPIKTTRRN